MINAADIERKLRAITRRQCQILFFVFQGLDYIEIGQRLGFSDKTIQGDMSKLYKEFGLTGKGLQEKRKILNEEIRPVYERIVRDPAADCMARPLETAPVQADEKATAEVIRDAQRGLIPLQRSLVYVPPPDSRGGRAANEARRGGGPGIVRQPVEIIAPTPPPTQVIPPWLIGSVVVLGVLLCIAIALIAVLLQGRSPGLPPDQEAALETAVALAHQTPAIIRQTVIVPQTVVVPATVVVVATAVPGIPITGPSPTDAVSNEPTAIPPPPTAQNVQDPPPGSIIPAGQGYSRGGVTLTLRKQIDSSDSAFGFHLLFENQSGEQVVILWKNSFIHVRDDKGTSYSQSTQDQPGWNKNKQFTIENGYTFELSTICSNPTFPGCLDSFQGTIDPSVKYLIFTVDQMAGMSNMNWRYDLP
jgi:DNA-binding CsgD family transcriptional regulator